MHDLEPFYRWDAYYSSQDDENSPFAGVSPNYQTYENDVYGYYIHPDWEGFGSQTLYTKLLFADYTQGFAVLEMLGEWNDTLHNDIMHLKRNVIEILVAAGINKFILLGEHVLNFHGGDDDYYQEWFEDVADGWIAFVNFRPHVTTELSRYHIDYYVTYGGQLDEMSTWRTDTPFTFCAQIQNILAQRLGPAL